MKTGKQFLKRLSCKISFISLYWGGSTTQWLKAQNLGTQNINYLHLLLLVNEKGSFTVSVKRSFNKPICWGLTQLSSTMFSKILTAMFLKGTSVCTSVTDSFSYAVWHHVNCANAVKPNPPIWCTRQVTTDSNSYLHTAVIKFWLFSTADWTQITILFLFQKNDCVLHVQLKLQPAFKLLVMWSTVCEK